MAEHRRGQGEGGVYKRKSDGRWVAAITLPSTNGKQRRKVITNLDKQKLLAELDEVKASLRKRGDLPTASQTVESWMSYWLDEILPKENRPKTVANYRSSVKTHINPIIGPIRLNKVTASDVRRVTANMSHLSSTTALTAHRIMSSAFAQAEREGRMPNNPAKLAKAPRAAATQLEVLTASEVTKLIGLFRGQPEAFLWATFLLTGARRGEILGLEWDRVTEVLDLSWQLQRHPLEIVAPADYEYRRLKGGLYLTRPKSKAGWRVVPLVPPLLGILELWREMAPPNPHSLVFAMPNGDPIDPDFASKQWPTVLASAGIDKHVRLHDLRHTAIDLLYEAGVHETTITEIVGHSSRSMTRAYKSRGNRPQLTDAMQSVSRLLGIQAELTP